MARGFDKKDFPQDWRNGSSDVIVETKAQGMSVNCCGCGVVILWRTNWGFAKYAKELG